MLHKDLGQLVGETITKVERAEYSFDDSEERVDEVYRISTQSGKVLYFLCDGGDCDHYGTIGEIQPEIFEENADGEHFLEDFKEI